ncbi:hypothetical protein IC803_07775 [Geobacillus sp. 46C-IIa]|uniref:hypothetical protein n=1 Tax=Geobacillus sp. 46C-IIa TaxID=1963025 RepID=UPI001301F5C2|nr:hypothetical protein [Geobacillus sp. 46C-IIa]QNU29786.1 hypothetical protein IC803_07775 [Geobacillus sp. 46C-IIa]
MFYQKRKVHYFRDRETVQAFIDPCKEGFPTAADPKRSLTIGAHMGDDDLINNLLM